MKPTVRSTNEPAGTLPLGGVTVRKRAGGEKRTARLSARYEPLLNTTWRPSSRVAFWMPIVWLLRVVVVMVRY